MKKKTFQKILFVLLLLVATNVTAQNFRSVWRTTAPNETITIKGGDFEVYEYSVDWGDGSSDVGQGNTSSHEYAVAGDYTITISGTFPRIYFNNSGDIEKIISIEEWGSSIEWISMENAFYGCVNLVNNATDVPIFSTSFKSFAGMFKDCTNIGTGTASNWSSWDTSTVFDMSEMFSNTSFNEDIGSWDVSIVSNMTDMFSGVKLSTINYDAILTGWNSQTLQNSVTFSAGNSNYCSQAGQDARANMIASDTWTITDGGLDCSYLTYFVTKWKTDNIGSSNSTSITIPTTGSGYNYDVDWNNDGTFDELGITGNITHDFGASGTYTIQIRGAFPRIYFNDSNDKLKILSVEQWGNTSWSSMERAFYGCANLVNNATDVPDLSSLINMAWTFRNCTNIGTGTATNWSDWDVSKVTSMWLLFNDATSFNKDITAWDVSKVQTFVGTFNGATSFNQNIRVWVVSEAIFMSSMFKNASSFNQNLDTWNVSKVTNMSQTFSGATSFNQDLGSWNVSAVTNMTLMFAGVTLSPTNYNSLLSGWNARTLKSGVTFDGGNSRYCSQEAVDARANMIASDSWAITDGGRITEVNWTGATDNDWDDDSNWDTCVPNSSLNVNVQIQGGMTAPFIRSSVNAVANNLSLSTIATTSYLSVLGSLTVNDFSIGATNYITVVNNASFIVSGNITAEDPNHEYLTYRVFDVVEEKWHLISSPVKGEEFNDAWNLANNINISGNNNNAGVGTYSNLNSEKGDWTYFKNGAASTTFDSGKGYTLLKKASGGTFYDFEGTYPDENIVLTINVGFAATNRWNLVGNPFPSYIKASELISANSSSLTDTHEFAYVWDNSLNSGNGGYKQIAGSDYIRPGQGFFVNASHSVVDNFTIAESLQSHQTGVTFYKNSRPTIKLMMNDGSNSKYTDIVYEENSTTGLDPGFDAGTFTGTSTNFSVYSHLVSDSEGVDFMLQSLPNSNYENMVIPIGVNATSGNEITFSVEASNLPSDIKVFLEDKHSNTFTRLDESNRNYKVILSEESNGIGRFYLHTKSSVLSVDDVNMDGISIYKTNNSNLRIVGLSQGKSTVKLFNMLGKQVLSTSFTSNGVHDISLPKLATGVYIVQLENEEGKLNQKIILE